MVLGSRVRRIAGAVVAAVIVVVDASSVGRHLLRLPAALTIAVGQEQGLALGLPGRVAVAAAGPRAGLVVDGRALGAGWMDLPGGVLRLRPEAAGTYVLRLRPWGVLPWPALRLDAVRMPRVVPGGQSVGLILHMPGALVVGEGGVPTASGTEPSPAGAAGVRVGDYVLRMDGRPVADAADVAAVLAQARGAPVSAVVLDRGKVRHLTLRPLYDVTTRHYALGVSLQGAVSGIGTLTFYDLQAHVFGALGHVVVDAGTGRPVRAFSGQLLPSFVVGVQPSRDGAPGEKLGVLLAGAPPIGLIRSNTPVGVFGRLLRTPAPGPAEEPLPVALADQVRPGPAELLTVVRGGAVDAFSARILAVDPGGPPGGRGFLVEVTDPRLLQTSGGIVQGMSGSPLIQGGRLVGALTHVFVNDPATGYGVLAEWMALAAGLGPAPTAPGSATGR